MTETERKMCEQQADATASSLDELWERIDAAYYDDDSYDDAVTELQERPLEIVWEKGEPFAVVLGTGGPHVEIRGGGRHDGTGYTLHVYWGGEHVTRYGAEGGGIDRTGAYFRELVEEIE